MTIDIQEQLAVVLKNTAETIARDIARAQGLTCDFVVSVNPFLEAHYSIKAGYPPTLIIQSQWLMGFVMASGDERELKKAKTKLRRAISVAVSKVPRMERTLSNSPPAEMILMLPGQKKWAKTNNPDNFSFSIPDDFIEEEESYTIRLKEINSGIEVSMSGTNPTLLRAQCRERLTHLVATNEALLERIAKDEALTRILPHSIDVKVSQSEDEEVKYNYIEEVKKDVNKSE